MYQPKMSSRLGAEALGTFWLVFVACGTAIFNGKVLSQSLTDSTPYRWAWAGSASRSPSVSSWRA